MPKPASKILAWPAGSAWDRRYQRYHFAESSA
jgi:hypothetical protein